METEIIESAVPLSESDIERIEERIGIKLPSELKMFLLKSNGGKPKPDTVCFEGEYFDSVAFFYGEEFRSYVSDLILSTENYRDLIPGHYLPFGESPGGNVYCLSLKDEDYGAVYYWDHEMANYDGEPWEENMTKLSNALSEFIDGLHEECA
ncbi:SMI1/KNR4 family protein [Methylomonas sp. MED-D]|nr:SMI1/KNR4 family protein [Methylomonas sp. MV1]MDT4329063.1 SMI1/KNR4 family protein [Methylomonas sp. MV1]